MQQLGKFRWRTWWVLPLLAGLLSCGAPGDNVVPPATSYQRGDLVYVTSSTSFGINYVNQAIAVLDQFGVDVSGLQGKYGVALISLVYKTVTPDGRLINASGVVAYPLKLAGASSPVLSFQHGTIYRDSEAPSNSANVDATLIAAAGAGFVVVMADYIGYAASGSEVHTYVQSDGLAAAIVDMLRAARQLLARRNVATNGQLFLTGYSEGGYATLAAQREMELHLASEFPITASAPAAGPYDMSGTAQSLLGRDTIEEPQLIGFVFKSYDHWYGWSRLNDIFQSPYNAIVDQYYDGTHSGATIKSQLTTSTAGLFNAVFLADFRGSGETAIKADIATNDIYNWAPQAPTRLFHGEDDTVVPYANTVTAVNAMNTAGAADLALVNCSTPPMVPRGHAECVPDYLTKLIAWFGALANDL